MSLATTPLAAAPFDILKKHKTPAEVELGAAQCRSSFSRYRQWVPRQANPSQSREGAFCNVTLGLFGELDEFVGGIERNEAVEDIASEFGDIVFYGAWLANLMQFSPSFLEDDPGKWVWTPTGATNCGTLRSGLAIAEPLKKTLFHGTDRTEAAGNAFGGAIKAAATLLARYAFGNDCGTAAARTFIRDAIAGNVRKLEARYPAGFVLGGGIREGAGR